MNKRMKLALVTLFLLLSFASISVVSAANNTTDMNLTYSTYHGGNGTEYGNAVAVDNAGNTYITGETNSPNFPTTPGAYQTTYGGGTNDVFLSKFNSTGNLIYSTYLGGSGNDRGYDIAADNSGNVYITGITTSSDFPTTTDAYQTTSGGVNDVFLSKFSSNGALIYSTYLGGSGNDNGQGVAVDNQGNIYISGLTGSPDFPTTTDAYQTTSGGGTDVFLVKFSSTGNLLYSTYLGGTGADYGYSMALDNNGNIYLTGYTQSLNFPTTTGAYQTTYGGSSDVFLSKFNSTGSLVYSTYLGGNSTDRIPTTGNSIAVDNSGNVYLTGYTQSLNFPTSIDAYQTTLDGTQDVFLSKFNSIGNLIYSTYLGGNSTEQGSAVTVDNQGNIYITGSTNSPNFTTTTGAYQTTHGGISDVFLSKFNSSGTLVYSTYLGGTGADMGRGIVVDNSGNIYITGYTGSSDFPTTNAYQITHGGGYDAFMAILSPDAGVTAPVADFTATPTNGTAPLTVNFTDTSTGDITEYAWDFNNDGTTDSTEQNPTWIYTMPGIYTVKLTVTGPNGNNTITKTNYITVNHPAPVADFTAAHTNGTAPLTVNFTDASTGAVEGYAWDFNNDGTVDSTEKNPTWTYSTPGTYTVKLTVTGPGGNNTVTKTGYITVNHPAPVADFTVTPTNGTAPLTVQFNDTSTGTVEGYAWDFNNDGTVDSTLKNPTWTYDTPGTYVVKLTVTGPGGSHTTTQTITVNHPLPVADFTATPTNGTAPLQVNFTDASTGNVTEYAWDFNNDGTVDSTLKNPTWTYDTPGTYVVKLTVTGPGGSHSTTQTITVNHPLPVADFTATPTNGTAPLTVNFTDASTGNVTEYAWDFNNDGTTDSTLQNPTWTYDTPGSYTVKLTVTGPGGSDSKTLNVTVVQPDTTAPVVQADVKGGLYNTTKTVTLSATDNQDPNPKIYYTINGTTPTTSSTLYTGPISISKTTTLKFIAVDSAGNTSPVRTETYTIDTTKPNVTKIDPVNGSVKVSPSKTIKVTFNEAIKKGSNFLVELKNSSGKAIPFIAIISGKVLTVDPTSNLAESLYTLTIRAGAVTDLAGNPAALITSKFSVGTAPKVTKVDPANGAVKVSPSKTIKVTFNEAIKKGSSFNVELKNSKGKKVAFKSSISGKVLTIKPNSKLAESLYTLTIPAGAVTDLAGNPAALITSKFSVGTSPKVTKIDPKNGAVKVSPSKTIKVTFNEAIKKGSKFNVELKNSKGKKVSFKNSISGKVLTIKPNSKLAESLYTLVIRAGAVTDLAGNPVVAKTSKFTVGTPPKVTKSDPKNNAKNIARNKAIKVTFNEAIKAGKNYRIELLIKNTKVAIKKAIKGKVLTITPAKALKSNTRYTLKIYTGSITDLAGNPQGLKTISFTTRRI